MIKNARGEEIDENEYDAKAYFFVKGDFDPEDISSQTGFPTSDRSRKAGDLGKYSKKPMAYSTWVLMSTLDPRQSLEAHVGDVIRQMDSNSTVFLELSRKYDAGMQLVGYFYRYPGLHFDKHIVVGLARYELSVDFDLYFPGPEDFL